MKERKLLTTKNIALIGMLGAIAAILMLFDVPLAFVAPNFYELDISELPVLIGTFAMGPVAGVLIEFIKVLIKMIIKPSSTAFVGELANFMIGCCLVVPAGMVYRRKRTKKGAIAGMIAGTLVMTVMAVFLNALFLLPFYANLYGTPIENLIAAGTAIHPSINNVWAFVLLCVAPFNLIKGVLVSVITALIYKPVSGAIHSVGNKK